MKKVYLIQTKVFYEWEGKDHQIADALEPITCVSSYKKAQEVMKGFETYYNKLGYQRKEKYNNLFPVEHFTMVNREYRVVIYILETDVE